jgi:hypothetical protein
VDGMEIMAIVRIFRLIAVGKSFNAVALSGGPERG